MPDLLAGSIIRALDFTPAVFDTQNDQFNCTNTTYGEGFTAGTYIQCAVVFVAPTSGRVEITYNANLDNAITTASTSVAPHVREGNVAGSGADVEVPSLSTADRNVGDDDRRYAASLALGGLTPGDSYNAVLEHRVSGNTGSIQYRHLIAKPLP